MALVDSDELRYRELYSFWSSTQAKLYDPVALRDNATEYSLAVQAYIEAFDEAEALRADQAGAYDLVLPVRLQNIEVDARLDTGAGCNVVSLAFSEGSGLRIHKHKRPKRIPAPGGHIISQGTITVPFQFQGRQQSLLEQRARLLYTDDSDTDEYASPQPQDKRPPKKLTFEVIKNCPYDLILGVEFVRKSQIFTKHKDKLKKVRRKTSTRSLHVVGSRRQDHLVQGTLGNKAVRALPDTCADANILSRQLAQWFNLPIDQNPGAQVEFQRVDGSIVKSTGIVRDVEWVFAAGGTSHTLDFYVLDDVDFHVILGKDFLFEIDAFMRYPLLLGSKGGLMEGLYVIQLVSGILSTRIRNLISGKRKANSAKAQRDKEDENEQNNRTAIEGWIMTLSKDEKETAWQEELKRRQRWERQQRAPPEANSSPQVGSGQMISVP